MQLVDVAREIGISGFLDIAFMSLLIYSLLVWFKRTRAAFVVIGMSIIGAAYLIARMLELSLTTTVFQGFFAIILIAVIVIFQEEIKHFFEQVGSRSSIRNLRGRKLLRVPRGEIEILIRTLIDLAIDRIGALIVVHGKDPIVRHLDGGVALNGELSEPLLKSIFDPHSVGHDGAVLIEGNTVNQFSCHLPLSKNLRKVGRGGTRHAAGLGLAELTDALCLIVSEERGTISIAHKGDIKVVRDAEELGAALERFYDDVLPTQVSKPWKDFFKKNYREKATALVATAILWFILVHGSKLDYRTFTVPVGYENLPPQLTVTRVEPQEVDVTFLGPRRSFYFVNSNDIRFTLKLFDAREGTLRETLSKSNISLPEGLSLESIDPDRVVVYIEAK
jgi:uncharacterized protein (TIGR00159 family)